MLEIIGRKAPVIFALLISGIAISAGIYLELMGHTASLNRAGSIVIAVGVVLGVSRFNEWIKAMTDEFLAKDFESEYEKVISSLGLEEKTLTLSAEEKVSLKSKIKIGVKDRINKVIEEEHGKQKAWEVYLVVFGTFVNGFGDVAVAFIKSQVGT